MDWKTYTEIAVIVLTVVLPLVIKLIEYVKKSVKEKNWNQLLSMVMELMKEAENKFGDGATRKQWVMAIVESSSKTINYDVDMEAVSELIDSLCDMSRIVNSGKYKEVK